MLRYINVALSLTVLFCYFEWPDDSSAFLFKMEYTVFLKGNKDESFTHPFILFPLIGQLLILISIFKPNRKLTLAGVIMLSLLVLMILVAGIATSNPKIILSTIPFLAISVYFIFKYKKFKPEVKN